MAGNKHAYYLIAGSRVNNSMVLKHEIALRGVDGLFDIGRCRGASLRDGLGS